MAFSYDDDLATDRDKVRFWLQDTTESQGPKPNNNNFSDAELDALITYEGTWQRAVAGGFEALVAAWQPKTSFSVLSGSFTRSDASKGYAKQATEWRERYGYGDEVATADIATKDLDFAGTTVTPLFQRKAFGHKVKDWDPE